MRALGASGSADARACALLRPYHVARAPHGVENARLPAGLELAPQVRDEDVHGVRLGERRVAPYVVEQRLTRHDEALVAHQVLEQLELARREVDPALVPEDLARVRVEAQVGHDQRGAAAGRAAAQERPQPGEQLLALERLVQVVVGARVEPRDAVVEAVARGEHQDRDVTATAQPARDLDAIELRQTEVEHDCVGLEHRRLLERRDAVLGELHVVALESQRAAQRAGDLDVVLDYKHARSAAHASMVGRKRALTQVFYGSFRRPNAVVPAAAGATAGVASPAQRPLVKAPGAAFVTLPRVNRRLRHLAVLATVCCLSAAAAAPARAFTAAEGRAAADRAAMAWARDYQQKDGAILDNIAHRPTYGYATLMIGYSVVRAGVRHHDPAVIRSGFRAIDAALKHNNPHRGVFDELVNATAYAWVRRHLPNDPSFRALRARWERYIVTIGEPFIGSSGLKKCTANPRCFHNHEAVGAFGDVQMLKTGLRSHVRGAKLSNPRALRASALHRLAVEIPPSVDSAASSTFGGTTRTGLGILSDTGTWPLAYHAFSTAMLAGAAADIGPSTPPRMRQTLLKTTGALAGMMAPDGDIAYLGRRQEQAWALASAIYAAVVGQHLRGIGAREAGELRAVADRAFTRLVTVNRNGPGGIGAVPRKLRPGQSYHGLDANSVTPVALTLFLLNLASDQAEATGLAPPGALPADADGAFLSRTKMAFAAVRRGDLWYVVHRHRITYDRRYDFGLVALKQRDASGRWHDVMRPRPNTRGHTHDSAGPVLERGTKIRYLPHGTSIEVRRGGVVVVHGGFQTQEGQWLRRGVTFRFAPVPGGVRMTFPLRAGDNARVTDFVPDGQAKRLGNTIYDDHSSAVVSPAPTRFRFLARGLGSCCDESMIEAMALLHAPRDQTYTYTVRAADGAPAGSEPVQPERRRKVSHGDGGGSGSGVIWAAAVALVLLFGAWRARRRRRVAR